MHENTLKKYDFKIYYKQGVSEMDEVTSKRRVLTVMVT